MIMGRETEAIRDVAYDERVNTICVRRTEPEDGSPTRCRSVARSTMDTRRSPVSKHRPVGVCSCSPCLYAMSRTAPFGSSALIIRCSHLNSEIARAGGVQSPAQIDDGRRFLSSPPSNPHPCPPEHPPWAYPRRHRRPVRLGPRPGRRAGEVARLGVRLLFQVAVEAEVTEFLGRERYAYGDRVRPGSRKATARRPSRPPPAGSPSSIGEAHRPRTPGAVDWCEAGTDVEARLPLLSTYPGHTHVHW